MKVAIHTLGCKVNSYESQAVLEQFKACGFEVVEFDQPADVYIVNTCSVTGEAARKSRQILNRGKKINPRAITVACGCYAQEAREELSPAADIIVGNNEKIRIAELVKIHAEQTDILVDDLTHCNAYEEQEISELGRNVRAYVKIQDGCDRFCSYCIIPYLRGRSRSRDEEAVVAEVKRLVDAGYKEVVITGIDISDYKKDGEGLKELLLKIDEIEGLERIRLGSLEEGIVDADFIRAISGMKKLCPHFHLSLQSGSDTVLKRMNRKYTTEEFKNTVELLRESFNDPAITTDIIVGFPGETEEEFLETCRFVEAVGFSAAHIFKYSRRKGTAADRMDDQIIERIKSERAEKLAAVTARLNREYKSRLIGKNRMVLIEEKAGAGDEGCFIGFTPEYIKVKVPGDKDLVNEIVEVCISEECFV